MIPESAGTKPSRESEVAILPVNLGKTEGREGPLLPSWVPCWKRQPDCPQGKAQPRPNRAERQALARFDKARKLQRALYRAAKQQPERRFTLLYDKVGRQDILQEAWQRVKSNKGAAGVDEVDIDEKHGSSRRLKRNLRR